VVKTAPMLPKADRCIFCDKDEIVEEHYFSRRWLERLWGVPKGEKLGHRHTRGDSTGEDFDLIWAQREPSLVVYCVCSDCNSGWMNNLDLRAQRLVDPMTKGNRTVLASLRDLHLMVGWVTKIAFMLDYRQDKPVIPSSVAAEFQRTLLPPEGTYIWLAASPPVIPGHAAGYTHTLGRSGERQVYLTTFRVDEYVAQLVIPLGGTQISPVRRRYEKAVCELWPLTYRTLAWPPEQTLDSVELVKFIGAFLGDFERFGLR